MSDKPDSIRSSRLTKSVHFAPLPDEPGMSQVSAAGAQSADTGTRNFQSGQFGSIPPHSRSSTWPSSATIEGPSMTNATSERYTVGSKRGADTEGTETTAPKRRYTGCGPPPSSPGRSAYQGPVVDGETAAQFSDRMHEDWENRVSKFTSHGHLSVTSDQASGVTDEYWAVKAKYDARAE